MTVRAVGRVHETTEERKNRILRKFVENRLSPGLAVSCKDGILLATQKKAQARKILRVFDRIAFVGVGEIADYDRLYTWASAYARKMGHDEWSPGDPRIFKNIVTGLASGVRSAFRDLFSSEYLECEVILAQVGFEKREDKICRVSCAGDIATSESVLVIPQKHKFPALGLESLHNLTMTEAFRVTSGLNQPLYLPDSEDERDLGDKKDEVFVEEAVVLLRAAVQEKRFAEVYHRLSSEEMAAWRTAE